MAPRDSQRCTRCAVVPPGAHIASRDSQTQGMMVVLWFVVPHITHTEGQCEGMVHASICLLDTFGMLGSPDSGAMRECASWLLADGE